MKKLYTPWRSNYAKDTQESKQEGISESACVFCMQCAQNNDDHFFIIKRYPSCIVMLARYPYNAGHLLVVPREHVANLNDLDKEERHELIDLSNLCAQILKETLKAQGINIGLNLGKIAGAGIPSHIHMHIVPRYEGDTNFFPVIADTKPISFDLREIYNTLKLAFD